MKRPLSGGSPSRSAFFPEVTTNKTEGQRRWISSTIPKPSMEPGIFTSVNTNATSPELRRTILGAKVFRRTSTRPGSSARTGTSPLRAGCVQNNKEASAHADRLWRAHCRAAGSSLSRTSSASRVFSGNILTSNCSLPGAGSGFRRPGFIGRQPLPENEELQLKFTVSAGREPSGIPTRGRPQRSRRDAAAYTVRMLSLS